MNTIFESELQATESEVSELRGKIVSLQNNDDNPLGMLRMAIENRMDPDALGKLMALCENYKAQRAVEQFSIALSEVQRLMPLVIKDAKGHNDKRYSTLENLITKIKPVYSQHGFSLSYGTEDSKLPNHIRITCDLRHTGGHKERYQVDLAIDTTGNKNAVQASGSTFSYGRRYLACLMFNVVIAGEDIDGNNPADFETITEAECLHVEDLIIDSGTNRQRFIDWIKTASVLVGDVPEVRYISQRGLVKVLDMLTKKQQENERKKAGAK